MQIRTHCGNFLLFALKFRSVRYQQNCHGTKQLVMCCKCGGNDNDKSKNVTNNFTIYWCPLGELYPNDFFKQVLFLSRQFISTLILKTSILMLDFCAKCLTIITCVHDSATRSAKGPLQFPMGDPNFGPF